MEGQSTAVKEFTKILNRLELGNLMRQPQNPPLKEQEISRLLEPLRVSSAMLSETLERILHAALMLARAEKGYAALRTDKGVMEFALGIDLRRQPLDAAGFHIDYELINASLDCRLPVRLPQNGDGFDGTNYLTTPLLIQNDQIGYIYLVGKSTLIAPSSEKWGLFQVFVEHAAVAVRNSQYHHLCKQWEGERESLQKHLMADEQLVLKGKMAAKIGHEINNFLSGINANIEIAADLLHEKGKRQAIIERLEKAQELITRMAALSNSLMSRSGLEANVEKSSLNAVVNKFVEFVEPIYRRSDVQIVKELDSRLPDCRIDQALMTQALFNITKNAVEARPDARITLRTHYDREKRRVVLTIEDNGPGMSAQKKNRLFNFSFTDKVGGHGYGLAICKDIVEKHQGEINVESEPRKGARFIISLPIVRMDDFAELEFERLEKLESSVRFIYPSVIRAKNSRSHAEQPVEFASITG